MPETKFYDCLEVTPDASTEQIAAAYRRLSLQLHPLRNPHQSRTYFTQKFSDVSCAYDVLSTPALREVYDQCGMESLLNGTEKRPAYTWMGQHFKIFQEFFGSENPWFDQLVQVSPIDAEIAAEEKKARAADIEVTVECSLFEFYNGALKEVFYQVQEVYDHGENDEDNKIDKSIMVTVKPGYGEHTTLRFPKMGN